MAVRAVSLATVTMALNFSVVKVVKGWGWELTAKAVRPGPSGFFALGHSFATRSGDITTASETLGLG